MSRLFDELRIALSRPDDEVPPEVPADLVRAILAARPKTKT